jgi:cystathionine beta-lyase/cystathionine gamma-synthase
LPSLAARMANMQKSAQYIAEWLEEHPKVEKVLYPGLESFPQRDLAEKQMRDYRGKFAPGSMIYFTLRDKGSANLAAEKFINHVADQAYCITLAVSLGQVKTLIENPYSMTHSAYLAVDANKARKNGHGSNDTNRVEPGGIRLSIGLEDRDDILADLEAGLEHA